MNILLFASAYNGMCQRIHCELLRDGHDVSIELSADEQDMIDAVEHSAPDIIICPFLKHRVPEVIWRAHTCLIVHPGVIGDRGPSSLDWAIQTGRSHWGVTVLQADAEMDAGDIWASEDFAVRATSKASLYRHEVISTATVLIKKILNERVSDPHFQPVPLEKLLSTATGRLLPLMKQQDRQINWETHSTAEIVTRINAADSFPGVLTELNGHAVFLYGARAEYRNTGLNPGELVGYCQGAIAIATLDGCVWIKQLKRAPHHGTTFFKLPAQQVLTRQLNQHGDFDALPLLTSQVVQDITVDIEHRIAWLRFDFYNGAMSTEQCQLLLARYRDVAAQADVKMIVLMGGDDFWSNGIHLNHIEVAEDPALESWRNINAINNLVREIITTTDKITIAALRSNAGAGGAIVPLACDRVIIRDGVVLNPHYLTMGLTGSEYWTYLLPRRVGDQRAQTLMNQCLPLLAADALNCGFADEMLCEDWHDYHIALRARCLEMVNSTDFEAQLLNKQHHRDTDEAHRPLESYRNDELKKMKAIFDNPDSDYHRFRNQFVYKFNCGKTPERLKSYHKASQRIPA